MPHAFFASERPLVFAHRGGSALAPENTLVAFDRGLACGADGLELDVQLSRDGVVVVHHDLTLDRTTNLRGAVRERTAAELARADAGWHFQREGEFPFRGRGHGVPTLRDVLERYPAARVIIELKAGGPALAAAVVEVVRAVGAVGRVCIGSFDLDPLRVVRRLEPNLATSASRPETARALLRVWCRCPLGAVPYVGFQVPECSGRLRVVSPRFLAAAHRAGLGVQVWTVDEPDQATRLLRAGVDGLITDRPDRIVPLCRSGDW